jgi:hypothetical protein
MLAFTTAELVLLGWAFGWGFLLFGLILRLLWGQ